MTVCLHTFSRSNAPLLATALQSVFIKSYANCAMLSLLENAHHLYRLFLFYRCYIDKITPVRSPITKDKLNLQTTWSQRVLAAWTSKLSENRRLAAASPVTAVHRTRSVPPLGIVRLTPARLKDDLEKHRAAKFKPRPTTPHSPRHHRSPESKSARAPLLPVTTAILFDSCCVNTDPAAVLGGVRND